MTKENCKPSIRFAGFNDAWEQRKLLELVMYRSSSLTVTDAKENGKYYLYDANSIIGNTDIEPIRTKYITIIKDGAGVGRIRQMPENTMFIGTMGALIADRRELNFIFALLTRFDLGKTFSGSTIPHIYFKDYGNNEYLIPNKIEQEVIGDFFHKLDNLITLHQRKYDKLTTVKKSMLEKMFPKNGCNVPEIRFKGFTDAWEQRKAIDIADYSKGNGYSKGNLIDIGTPIILYGRLYTKYQFTISEVDTFAVPRNGAVYSQGNEVIVPASGETAEDIARASAIEKSGILLGGDLNILRPFDFINPLFLALAISNGEPQKELAKKAQGKSVVHIHNTDIQEVTIVYPSKTEQDRIVSVFRQLDNLITLHQRKLEKLKNIKKACLEKMFV